ncbi:MAG: DNA polymerase III subunit alpha [Solobacterium sp.]|nr:DNA polymerase III subunit alpha [Solobacterium sp.]
MPVHLHVRSCYTLLSSTIQPTKLVKQAKKLGYEAVALTDHNVMHGVAPFLHACKEEGIKPIVGMEVDCYYEEARIPFLLLAKDNIGYQNLMILSSIINQEKQYCTYEELCKYKAHCALIVYGEGGYFDSALIAEERSEIQEKLAKLKKDFEEFDVALSYQDASLWRIKNALLKRICANMGIQTVALNKIYYLENTEEEAYRVLNGIRQQKTILDQTLPKEKGRYFLSIEEMKQLYEEEDLKRTEEIARECVADFVLPKTELPTFETPKGLTSAQYLTQLCLAGLKKRLHNQENAEYKKRLKYELSVIIDMHFEDYFLIVYDFIREARARGIYVGPGRGSAAGSLVSYCLGITQIDPIPFSLLFERFLNPERITMPDIDTDIPDNDRQTVIDYVVNKYGVNHVAHIVTFGTLAAKQVLRDVGKVLNLSTHDIDLLARLIPNTPKITLEKALSQSKRLKEIVEADARFIHLFSIAKQLEGLPRHSSTHAGGIIMSRLPLTDVIPTMRLDDAMQVSQYTMEYLEERGLIKMDFLGLRNLSIIDAIVKRIQKTNPNFKLFEIPLNDEKTLSIFRNVDTIGIFQFESEGMRNLLRKVQPNSFDDLVATVALFRPGPMENIPLYLENKKHPQTIVYPHPDLEDILKETYGVMIYQEQIMQTAEKIAGFSLGKADILRRAMSKKKKEEIDSLRSSFVEGCVQNGYTAALGESLFSTIEKFAGYGFNKAHSVAYSLIAYQMAYLKANAPLYFYCALLDNVIGDEVKTSQYIHEASSRNIEVLAPDVNKSQNQYEMEGNALRMPFSAVKSVGVHTGSLLVAIRKEKEFADYFDFVARCQIHKVSRKAIENLIQAGACDAFGENRMTYLAGLDDALNYADLIQVNHNGQLQIDLNLVSKPVLVKRKESKEEMSEREKDALGFCLGPHPIETIKVTNHIHVKSLQQLLNETGEVTGFALVQSIREHRTRKGDMMAFLKVIDESAELTLMVMPKLFQVLHERLQKGSYILFHGKMTEDNACIASKISFFKQEVRR